MKRALDIVISVIGLIGVFPIMTPVSILVWLQDFESPFYIAQRVGKGGILFKMFKIRSMVVNADKSAVVSTGANDKRITSIGRFIRKYKLDELSQLWNVLKGEMSLVGPRPNVKREVDAYTKEELALISIEPGITDISSIVFSDEAEILKDSVDPDLDYNRLIRPWKSRLGILYVENRNILLDIKLIFLTAVAIFSRKHALSGVHTILVKLKADPELINVSKRENPLYPFPPPGSNEIVQTIAA